MNNPTEGEESNIILNADYWNARYQSGQTGWDMHQASPPLTHYIDTVGQKEVRILIPGCGNAHEAAYLLEKGFTNVTLIDISEIVTTRLRAKYEGQSLKIICGDFFKYTGIYDLILEQTFFCTLPPIMREAYVSKCAQLLDLNGKVAGLLFNKPLGMPGPPYITHNEDYKKLFEKHFRLNIFEDCYNSIPPRLGTEAFFEIEVF